MTNRSTIGYRLAALGIAWVLITLGADIGLHVFGRVELPRHLMYVSLSVGAVIGWWGFFWVDSKSAKEGGTFVLDASERVHLHRRATDPPANVAAPASDGIAVPSAPAPPVAPVPDLSKIPAPEKGP